MKKTMTVILTLCLLTLTTNASATSIVFSVGGNSSPSSIQGTVDAFRAALGDPNNGNAAGPLATGRREINWDGGGATTGAAGPTPFTVFLNNRGALFTTPGTGFLQAPLTGIGGLDEINSSYSSTFGFFSPVRLFVPQGSTLTDATFFIPGTNGLDAASIRGFGAVFTDVDLNSSSSLAFFDTVGNLLGNFSVPAGTVANGSLSFLGVVFTDERIGRVRITSGSTPLGPNDNPAAGTDVVALDDVLYSEPQRLPEPSAVVLCSTGLLALIAMRRYRRRVM